MNIRGKLTLMWGEFWYESKYRLAGFIGLIVSLSLLRNSVAPNKKVVVVVDRWDEAIMLSVFGLLKLLVEHRVLFIAKSASLLTYELFDEIGVYFVTTKSVYLRYYPSLLQANKDMRLLII